MLSRRSILKHFATGSLATFTPYFAQTSQCAIAQTAPSDRLRIGCIGLGNRGTGNTYEFSGLGDVVALCDIDSGYAPVVAARGNPRLGSGPEKNRTAPDFYDDYRRLLDRNDIDIVCIGTPDHWHTKLTMEALDASKHVFCEKPLTLTLEENQRVRAAAERSNRVVQVGSQQRIIRDQFIIAALLVQKGAIGRIKRVVCDVGPGPVCDPLPVVEPPETFLWDRWLGQAPMTDYIGGGKFFDGRWELSRSHRVFRYFYDYSGGTVTDWGAHHLDSALMALGLQTRGTGPYRIDGRNVEMAVRFENGYPTETNRFNTPKTFDIVFSFDSKTGSEYLTDDCRLHLVSDSADGNGILFEGENGRFHVNRDRIKGKVIEELGAKPYSDDECRTLNKGKPFESHKQNFIRAIREGGLPASDVETHTLAMNCCHLAGIAARLGREIEWDPVTERIVGDDQAASFAARSPRPGYELPMI